MPDSPASGINKNLHPERLLVAERGTPCTPTLLVGGKEYTLHIHTVPLVSLCSTCQREKV
jgi:hypothetical protein